MKLIKPKKWNKTKAKRELDKLFSLEIRKPGVCWAKGKDKVHCGGVLQCAHVIGRANLNLHWNALNALPLCAGHHVYYTYHPEAWRELMMERYMSEYLYLLQQREVKIKFNETFYKNKLAELDELYRAMKDDHIIQ